MATANSIISRAMRLLGVLDAGEAMEADAAQDALDVLNAMLAEWYETGIGLPDYSIDTLTTALASDAADSEAIAYQLAIRIAPEYAVSVSPELGQIAEQTMGRLRLRYFEIGDSDFAELPSPSLTYNINNDA